MIDFWSKHNFKKQMPNTAVFYENKVRFFLFGSIDSGCDSVILGYYTVICCILLSLFVITLYRIVPSKSEAKWHALLTQISSMSAFRL